MASPTIKSIAEAAHVSVATVSLALRNHPRISRDTIERIHGIARSQGYRPNPLVTALMTHVRATAPTRNEAVATLGFINAYPEKDPLKVSPSFALNFQGARDRAEQMGYRLDTFWAKETSMTARRLTNILQARGIYGILVGPLPHSKGHLSLLWPQFSASSIGYSMWRPHLHRAVSHHAHAMSLALRKLNRLGYRRIGLAMSPNFNERVDHHWLANFLFYQFYIKEKDRIPPLIDETNNMQNFPRWFKQHKPDAVISAHVSGYEWLVKLKVNIPDEVGFAHLDLDPHQVEFSGINQRPDLIGAAAMDLLINQMNRNERGIPIDPKLLLIESSWVNGATTRKPMIGLDGEAEDLRWRPEREPQRTKPKRARKSAAQS